MARSSSKGTSRPHWFSRKRLLAGLATLALLGIAGRLALPHLVLRFVNGKLDEIPGYQGHVGDVDIHLWRGAYTIHDVSLEKLDGEVPVPFFSAQSVDLSVQWRALRQGSVVGEVDLRSPRLNFVNAATDARSQTEIDDSWRDKVADLFPLNINHLRVHDGEIHFRDFDRKPVVDLHLDHLEGEAQGLTNGPHEGELLPAEVHVVGRAMDEAALRVDVRLDPLSAQPTFDLDGELTGLALPKLNDFLRAYALVDVEKGTFDLFTEMAASEGAFQGYVKPLARNVSVLNLKEDVKSPLKLVWETVVATVAKVLTNPHKSQIGTEIPLAGRFANPSPNVWSAIANLLRNAFISALSPSIEHTIDLTGKPRPK